MCRLLALSCRRSPSMEILEKFKSLAFEGQTPTLGPDARGHNDGWGLAGFSGTRMILEKSALSATDADGRWDEAIKRLMMPAVWPAHFMFHLRRASPGLDVRVSNSHPFHRKCNGSDWFFMHNGTAEGFDPERHHGMIDSEFFMELAMKNMEGGAELKDALHAAKAAFLEQYPKMDSFVGIFLHPRGLEAFYDVPDKFDRYHTLYRAESEGAVFICSENMKVEDLEWKPIREMGGVVSVPSFRKG